MKSLFDKAASGFAYAMVMIAGAGLAGLGLMMVMLLAVFALAAAAVSLLASPFAARALEDAQKEATAQA